MKPSIPEDPGNDLLKRLFEQARPRPRPPQQVEDELRARLFAEWKSVTGRQRQWRTMALGIAASLLVAGLAVVYQVAKSPVAPVAIAAVERQQGTELMWGDDASGYLQPLGADHTFTAGQRLATGTGSRVALVHRGGGSLRLDERTTLAFIADDIYELTSGRVYFDSEDSSATDISRFHIRTAFGEVHHVGTQFMVDVSGSMLAVSVREGRVQVENYQGQADLDAGSRLILSLDGHSRQRKISTYGDDWEWTESVTPVIDMNRRPLHDFLQWAARQSGRRIAYADPAAEVVARDSRLFGSIALPPLEAVAATLPTADLEYQTVGDTIFVSRVAD